MKARTDASLDGDAHKALPARQEHGLPGGRRAHEDACGALRLHAHAAALQQALERARICAHEPSHSKE
jgi:hypothetical protein